MKMKKRGRVALCVVVAVLAWVTINLAQSQGFDQDAVALLYHKISGDPLDMSNVAQQSERVQRASNFDRPDVIKGEIARLQGLIAAVDPAREFVIRVNDSISEYDHGRSEFSIMLFRPGYFVPIQAFGQQYQMVFANAESARPIPMAKDQAREFDAQLNRTNRQVTNEIHFRVTGKGDPAGGVTGARVIRAEILSARLLGPSGAVIFTPKVLPYQIATGALGSVFNAAHVDVAGLRVSVKAKDLETTLTRLFGPTARRAMSKGVDSRLTGALTVNEMGCINFPDGRHDPKSGAVCVTAFFDNDDIVRAVRIERVFTWFDAEVFRKSLTQKYGAVASALTVGQQFSLGWGPEVDPALLYDKSGPHTALTAHYTPNDSFFSRGNNSLPQIRVVLSLVDAQWDAGHRQ